MTEKRRPGHPVMAPELKKKNFTTKLSPEWLQFLEEMKARGHTKASVINKGLELARKYLKKSGEM